jgi:cytochrome c-type biogenesis protein
MVPEIGWLLAVGAGMLSFFSPCVIPVVPAYISFVTGLSAEEVMDRRPPLKRTLPPMILFCAGFSLVFVLLGATASAIGQMVHEYQWVIRWAGGFIVILFGFYLLGDLQLWAVRLAGLASVALGAVSIAGGAVDAVLAVSFAGLFLLFLVLMKVGVSQWRLLQMERRIHLRRRPVHSLAAFVIGVTFAAGWSPCIGPILGGILAYAGTRETLSQGLTLLAFYSMGMAVPFLGLGIALGALMPWISRAKRVLMWVSAASGVLLMLLGALIITDNLNLLYMPFG